MKKISSWCFTSLGDLKLLTISIDSGCFHTALYSVTPMISYLLPIYNAPPLNSRYIDEKPGRLQTGISSVRKTTSYYVKGCKDAYLFVKNGIISSIQFGKDAYVYLKNPPPEFLPKVGVITVSGLTGLVLARKGSRFKKISYPLGLCALGISLCYPAQSVIVAKVTGGKVYAVSHKTYEAIGSLWTKKSTTEVPLAQDKPQEVPGSGHSVSEARKLALDSEKRVKASEVQFHAEKMLPQTDSTPLIAEAKAPSVRSDALNIPQFKPDPCLMDHGQSSPEDVDMYSTRS
ncbi:MICOS complex subunit MIC27 isoform X2 [Rhineura floridana]|uniref:MICOS complex subunit MIC27 isoform X2 n=1 Tax=Rhineura floridana TaxID=261503 RepID=UPI002AC86541|nr:MICOS complex subunit MIC27 isoform X2 [Rhineura floridana]